ncbi:MULTISPECIES: DinB family protein [Hymenobacter]|uniref:DinB family protein n=1 Tax=Hymenobacter jejuensis TaxID=2502781 RepID=A0A5B8A599_9BACT|nr:MULTISPECIES: DinB family protein [Hymenobacter]MBC6992032.1 DinB family protein [Hymenobacter sp. BT491]QDA62389.1 DinB family protein [Hymenobacter jejuensis]
MNHRLHIRFEQLEHATDRLLQAAAALGDKSHLSPAPGHWSADQVIQHLVVAETGIAQYIDKKLLQAESLQKSGFGSFWRSALLRVLLRVPFAKFKTPAKLAALTPAEVPSLPQLQSQWQSVRRRLEQMLNEFPSKLLDRAIFRHPRSGMLNIYQTLDFMLDHVLHHQRQMERITQQINTK